jgi:hypothetical protein
MIPMRFRFPGKPPCKADIGFPLPRPSDERLSSSSKLVSALPVLIHDMAFASGVVASSSLGLVIDVGVRGIAL